MNEENKDNKNNIENKEEKDLVIKKNRKIKKKISKKKRKSDVNVNNHKIIKPKTTIDIKRADSLKIKEINSMRNIFETKVKWQAMID